MSSRVELRPITGLRAFAALWVVFYHYYNVLVIVLPSLALLLPFQLSGFLGVDVFFTLSGFVISLTYMDKFKSFDWKEYFYFLWLRLARIYPVYVFSLLLFAISIYAANFMGVSFSSTTVFYQLDFKSFLATLFMIQAWGNGDLPIWNNVAWSVSAEWFAYLLFPFLAILLLWRVSKPLQIILIGFSVLGLSIILDVTKALGYFLPFDFSNLLRIVGSFTAGAMMYLLYRHGIGNSWNWKIITPLIFIGFVAACLVIYWLNLEPRLLILLMPLFILGIAYEGSWVSAFLGTKLVHYGGKLSYSLYLTHFIVLTIVSKLLPTSKFAESGLIIRLGICVAYILAFVIAAIASYHIIEEPGRKFLRRLWSAKKTTSPVQQLVK